MRRKGEKKLETTWPDYAVDSIRHMIGTGTNWLRAWSMQACSQLYVIERKTGIEADRLMEIEAGAPITRKELEAVAAVWSIDPERVIGTMPDGALLADHEYSRPSAA